MKHTFFIPLLLAPAFAFGQNVVATGGSYHQGTNNSISYTIGEPVISTENNASHQLTQGFQQPWADITIAVEEPNMDASTISVYPNPVRHVLHLSLSDAPIDHRFELFDALGKQLLSDRIQSTVTDIDMEQYASGGYFLRVFGPNDSGLRTFKISVAQ